MSNITTVCQRRDERGRALDRPRREVRHRWRAPTGDSRHNRAAWRYKGVHVRGGLGCPRATGPPYRQVTGAPGLGGEMADNTFDTRDTLTVDGNDYEIYRLDKVPGAERLPYSLKVLLENLLRNEDGVSVTAD